MVLFQEKKIRENGKRAKLGSCVAETLAVFLEVMKHFLRMQNLFFSNLSLFSYGLVWGGQTV